MSHRVSSAKNADLILVLDEGKIIQRGTHQESIKSEKAIIKSFTTNNLLSNLAESELKKIQ